MSIIDEIFRRSNSKKIKFEVIDYDQDVLLRYNNSVGWYLTCLYGDGDFIDGIEYMGVTINETIIEVYYYPKEVTVEELIEFFRQKGLVIKL